MDTSPHADTQTYSIHSYKNKKKKRKKKEREKERIPAEAKIYYGQLTPTENSQTQILKLKINLSNQSPLYESKRIQEQTILLPKDNVKR